MPPQQRSLEDLILGDLPRGGGGGVRRTGPGPGPGPASLDDLLSDEPGDLADLVTPELSPWRRYGAMAVRGLGSALGALGGSLLAPGAGTVAGGVAGGGVGEWLAEKMEGRDASPLEIATQAGIGLIPTGGSIARVALKSALAGGVGSGASAVAREGLPQDVEQAREILQEAGSGALIGGAGGALAEKFLGAFRGGSAARSTRDLLREEAATARPGLLRATAHEDLSDLVSGESHAVPGETFGPGLTRREQIAGLDPDRLTPHPTQDPRLRSENRVIDVGSDGPADPWADRPLGPDHQGPAGDLPPYLATRRSRTGSTGVAADEGRATAEPWDISGSETAGAQPGVLPFDDLTVDPEHARLQHELDFETRSHANTFRWFRNIIDELKGTGGPSHGSLEILDPHTATLNGSGESGASLEAIRRAEGMAERGEQFVKYDRLGQRHALLGPDAVDYVAQPGETYGIENAQGEFQTLDAHGGRVPQSGGSGAGELRGSAVTAPEPEAGSVDLGVLDDESGAPSLPAFLRPRDPKRTFIPSELYAAWLKLRPKWDATRAATGVNQGEDLLPFAERVLQEPNPRKLMGAERKAIRLADEAGKPRIVRPEAPRDVASPRGVQEGGFADRLGDESGSIDPALARRLGLHVGSGIVSAGVAGATSDDAHRTENMIGAGLAGAAAPFAITHPEILSKLRYFSMLGSASAQAKNLIGNAGSVAVRAAEEALTGNTAGASRILRSVFGKDTADRVMEAFKYAPVHPGDERWGSTTGALGVPSRLMHAVDEGVTQGLETGGLTHDDAKLSLFTSEPRSKAGRWLANRPSSMGFALPFVRTAANIMERGLEHTPGVGLLPGVRAMRGDAANRVAARQAMGALALILGASSGASNPYLGVALGPLGLPFALGASGRVAAEKKGDDFTNILRAEADTLRRAVPLPTDAYTLDPSTFLASFIPGVLKDASTVSPTDFDTSGSVFDRAVAKVPFLNERVLPRKRKRRNR